MLVQPETFPEQAAGTGTLHCAADFTARHDTQFGRSPLGEHIPIGDQATLGQPFALLPDSEEVPILRHP